MTRLPDPYAVRPTSGDPYALTQSMDLSRVPNLQEYAGYADDSPESLEARTIDALDTGKAAEYADFLHRQWQIAPAGTPGRRHLYDEMTRVRQDVSRWETGRPARERAAAIQKAAEAQRETGFGAFEDRLAKTAYGQLLFAGQRGIEGLATSVTEQILRPFAPEAARRIRDERAVREEFLRQAQAGSDWEALLGKTGSTVVTEATTSIAQLGPLKAIGGTVGPGTSVAAVYGGFGMSAYSQALQQAEDDFGLTGGEAKKFALKQAGYETAMMFTFNRLAKAFGLKTFEEDIPGRVARQTAVKLGEKLGVKATIEKFLKTVGGPGFEGGEELFTDILQQAGEITENPGQEFSWERALVSAATGVAAAGGKAVVDEATIQQQASQAAAKINQQLQDGIRVMRDSASAVDNVMIAIETLAPRGEANVSTTADEIGPLAAVGEAPPVETGLPSETELALPDTAEAVSQEQTGAQEADGGAITTKPGTYPSDIDERLRQAQVTAFLARVTPEQLDAMLMTRETIAPQVEVESQAESELAPGAESVAQVEVGRPLAESRPTPADREKVARPAATSEETAIAEPVVASETDTEQQNFTDMTGIEKTSVEYRDAFWDAIAAYHTPAAAEPDAPPSGASPLKGKTREEIRINSARRKMLAAQEQIRVLRDALAETGAIRAEWLSDAQFLVESNVPPELHSRYNRDLQKLVESPSIAKFKRLIDRVDRWARKNDAKQEQHNFLEALRNAKDIDRETRAMIDDLIGGIDTQTEANRRKLQKVFDRLNSDPSAPASTEQREAFGLLQKKHYTKLTGDELRALAETVESLTFKSKYRHLLRQADRQFLLGETTQAIADEFNAAKPLSQSNVTGVKRLVPPRFRPEHWEVDRYRPVLSLRPADSKLFREWGMRTEALLAAGSEVLRNQAWEELYIKGDDQCNKDFRVIHEGLEQVLVNHGLTFGAGHTFLGVGGAITSPLEAWRETKRKFGSNWLSRGEALEIVVLAMDPDNRAQMKKNGVRIERGKTREVKVTPERLAELADFIGVAGQDVAAHMFRQYNSTIIDRVNEEWEIKEGHPLTLKRNVVPREVANEPVDYTGRDEQGHLLFNKQLLDQTLDGYSHTKKRTQSEHPIVVRHDGFDKYLRHADRMMRIAAYLNPHRDTIAILEDPKVKQAILRHGGQTEYDRIVESVNRQVLPPGREADVSKTLRHFNRLWSTAALGFRIPPAVLNVTSLPLTAAQQPGGFGRLARAAAIFASNPQAAKERLMQAPKAWKRFQADQFLNELSYGAFNATSYLRPVPFANRTTELIRQSELRGTAPIRYVMAELYVQDQGIAETDPSYRDEVNREWARMMARSENSSDPMEMTGLQLMTQDQPALYPVTSFSSSVSRLYSAAMSARDQFHQGDKRGAVRTLAGVSFSLILAAMMEDLWSHEDVGGEWPERIAKRTMLNTLGTHPLGDEIGQRLARWVAGMRVYHRDDAGVLSLLQDVTNDLGTAYRRFEEGDQEKGWEALARAIEDTNIVAGLAGAKDIWRRVETGHFLPGIQGYEDK